jgi:hypothetical protein
MMGVMAKFSVRTMIFAPAITIAGLIAAVVPFKYESYFDRSAFTAIGLVFIGCSAIGLGLALPFKRPVLGFILGIVTAIAVLFVAVISAAPQ